MSNLKYVNFEFRRNNILPNHLLCIPGQRASDPHPRVRLLRLEGHRNLKAGVRGVQHHAGTAGQVILTLPFELFFYHKSLKQDKEEEIERERERARERETNGSLVHGLIKKTF